MLRIISWFTIDCFRFTCFDTIVSILDLSNKSKTKFSKIWFYRIKVLTFRFGCSYTLNSKCGRWPWSLIDLRSFVWWLNLVLGTLPMGRKEGWRLWLFISLWMVEDKSDGNPNPYEVFIGFLTKLKWLEPI